MAITELTASEAVSTTEHSLATDTSYDTGDAQTTEGILQGVLDLSDMIAGDQLQVRIYEKVRSGDTQRIVYEAILTGAQVEPIWPMPALAVKHGWDVTADALAGTITVNSSLRVIPATFTEITGTEAIGATEHSLATDTSYDTGDAQTGDGVLQAWLDLSDMVAGDQIQIRVYEKARSGDTQRVVLQQILTGAQSQPIWTHPAIEVMHGWDVTADALAGTITVNWSLRLTPVA